MIRGSIIRKEFLTNGDRDFDFRHPHCPQPPAAPPNTIEIRHLGSGGISIRWRDDVVLLGPYFSRPGSLTAAQFGRVRFDDVRIAAGMRPFDATKVRAIMTGHSHFDHLADVPRVAQRATSAVVYTNASGVNMLAAYPHIPALPVRIDEWVRVPNSAIRFRAIESAHAPQLCCLNHWPCTYAAGEVDHPWSGDWSEKHYRDMRGGATFAYIIDLLDEHDDVRYRIYYNDAAAAPPKGIPSADLTPVDLAVVCMASYDFVRDYPDELLRKLQPRHVLVSHFDDFFDVQDGAWTFVPLLTDNKANEFMRRVRDALRHATTQPRPPITPVCGPMTERWSMPVPGWPLYFAI